MKVTRTLIMMLIVAIGMAATAMGQVVTTNVWTNFGGLDCTLNGAAMPAGSIVQAFDQSGVLCGERVTTAPGVYIATSVYGDENSTAPDEGCVFDEVIVFKVNGRVATKLGPDSDHWVGYDKIKIMNLASTQAFDVNVSGPDGSLGLAGDPVSYTVSIQNTGDGIDWVNVDLQSSLGWTVTNDLASLSFYLNPGETRQFQAVVHIPGSATVGLEDELTVTATSLLDPSADHFKKITTTVDQSTDVSDNPYVLPGLFSLNQNYPNPFNPETKISFSMEKAGEVNLDVFDILGRKISNLHSGYLGAGQYEMTWHGVDQSGRQVASGIYFYRLTANDKTLTRKMTLLK